MSSSSSDDGEGFLGRCDPELFGDPVPASQEAAKGGGSEAVQAPEEALDDRASSQGEDDEDVQVPERRLLPRPGNPTPEEVAENEASGHVQYRACCRSCVEARRGDGASLC